MKRYHIFVVIVAMFFAPLRASEKEHYTETDNCVRIFDWDTLDLLMKTKISKVNIDARSGDELLLQISKALKGMKEVEGLIIDFEPGFRKRQKPNGTQEKPIALRTELRLINIPLLTLIRYICDQNKMTFSVKKGEVIFRPLLG